jgi:hypothetical protein
MSGQPRLLVVVAALAASLAVVPATPAWAHVATPAAAPADVAATSPTTTRLDAVRDASGTVAVPAPRPESRPPVEAGLALGLLLAAGLARQRRGLVAGLVLLVAVLGDRDERALRSSRR